MFIVQFPYYVKGYNLLANLVSVVEEQCLGLVKCGNTYCVENMISMATIFTKVKMFHELIFFVIHAWKEEREIVEVESFVDCTLGGSSQ